jgi:hypothetical protein
MNDCAWCGTGEGICSEHLQALFAESKALAATGQYLARDDNEDRQVQATTPPDGEAEHNTATAS